VTTYLHCELMQRCCDFLGLCRTEVAHRGAGETPQLRLPSGLRMGFFTHTSRDAVSLHAFSALLKRVIQSSQT
jgi:hypothetical protein